MTKGQSIRILFCFIFCFSAVKSGAQLSNTFYLMDDIAETSWLNPAFQGNDEFVIGLPFLSGFSVGFNNDFKLNMVTRKGYGILSDTLMFDFNSFYNELNGKNRVNFEVDNAMFFIGMLRGKNYYTVSLNEKGFFRGDFDKRFIEFFTLGTKPYYGSDSEIGGLNFNLAQYREFGFGFSRKVNKKLTYGLRLKMLFGRMIMDSENLQFAFRTSMDEKALYLTPSGDVKISGPVKFEIDTIEQTTRLRNDLKTDDYFFNFRNLGLATDFGIQYQYSKNLELSASIIDLGFLRFSNKNFLMNSEYELWYPEDSLTQATDPWAYDYFSSNAAMYAFRDSIPYMTTASRNPKAQYSRLPFKIYLAAKYNINRDWQAGFVGKFYILENYFYTVATFSAETDLSENLRITCSNSIIRNSFLNPGFGFNFKSKLATVYFAADNIFAAISPSAVKNLNLQFGINLKINNE